MRAREREWGSKRREDTSGEETDGDWVRFSLDAWNTTIRNEKGVAIAGGTSTRTSTARFAGRTTH